jgi:hypothetical protein
MSPQERQMQLPSSGGKRWCSWLRHCATSRKVAVSIPEGITGIFHWHNSSARITFLGSTQPLREMTIRNISWRGGGGRRPVRRADKRVTFFAGCHEIWKPQPPGTLRASPSLCSDWFTFTSLGYDIMSANYDWMNAESFKSHHLSDACLSNMQPFEEQQLLSLSGTLRCARHNFK